MQEKFIAAQELKVRMLVLSLLYLFFWKLKLLNRLLNPCLHIHENGNKLVAFVISKYISVNKDSLDLLQI
jgi:hypothetical protein